MKKPIDRVSFLTPSRDWFTVNNGLAYLYKPAKAVGPRINQPR